METREARGEGVHLATALGERGEPRGIGGGELVNLPQLDVKGLERVLPDAQLAGLRGKAIEPVSNLAGSREQIVDGVVGGGDRAHSALGVAERRLQRPKLLVERVDRLPVDGELLHPAANQLGQRAAVALEARNLAREVFPGPGRFFELSGRVGREALHPAEHLLGPSDLFAALIEPADLRFHRPDHLVQPLGLDDRVIHGVLLAFERLHLVADVLGKLVERGEPLVGGLAERLQLGDGAQALLHFGDRLQRCGRTDAGVVGSLVQPAVERFGGRRALVDALEPDGDLAQSCGGGRRRFVDRLE